MAEQAKSTATARPLSPHMQIYRWPVTMATSIVHRATGLALAAGTLFVAWWLIAIATGPYAYNLFSMVARSLGGQIVLFEDVTTKMGLRSSYNAAINVQRAILDTLEEGAAIFGPDGRLKRHNAVFARQWRLSDEELSDEPHLKRIAEACSTRFGNGRIWEIVSAGISSAAPEQYNDAERFERPDHSVLSLMLKRLPDATTLARFADITDQVRFELDLRASDGGPQAAVAV